MDKREIEEKLWFQGRKTQDTRLDLSFVGQGTDQEGPAFYFTDSYEDALGYARPAGIVLTGRMSLRKIASSEKPADRKEIQQLIEWAPDYLDKLTNWHEKPKQALKIVLDSILKYNPIQKDAFQQVWIDFYRQEPAEYLQHLVTLGYDGHIPSGSWGSQHHFLLYNPKAFRLEDHGEVGESSTTSDALQTPISERHDYGPSWNGTSKATVEAGLSDTLYHYTSLNNLLSILRENQFVLTTTAGSGAEGLTGPPADHFYFFSTTRSRMGSYGRGAGPQSVYLVLDGKKLHQKYSGNPIDYWGPQYRKAEPSKHEMEDRIWSREQTIPEATQYIKEIHVRMGDPERGVWKHWLREAYELARQRGIPIYIYRSEDRGAFQLQDKRKAIKFEDLNLETTEEPEAPYRRTFDFDKKFFAEILELYEKTSYESLSKEAHRKALTLGWNPQEFTTVLMAAIHNNKSNPNSGINDIIGILRKEKLKDIPALTEFLRNKWTEIHKKSQSAVEAATRVVYHGSDGLPKGKIPRLPPEGGVYVAESEDLAREFGTTIHEFYLDDDQILDLRKPAHQELVLKQFGPDILNRLTDSKSKTPSAVRADVLDLVRDVTDELGFKGCVEDENLGGTLRGQLSIEIFDTSCLKPKTARAWSGFYAWDDQDDPLYPTPPNEGMGSDQRTMPKQSMDWPNLKLQAAVTKLPADQIVEYVKEQHQREDWEDTDLEERIYLYAEFELKNVNPKKLNLGSFDIDWEYAGQLTEQDIKKHPIVIGDYGEIIDGNHRAEQAAKLGLTSIPAWVPVGSKIKAAKVEGSDKFKDEGFVEGNWGSQGSGILFRCRNKILLLERAGWVEEPGTWGIPGGAVPVSKDGTPMDVKQSAIKETTEEIGPMPKVRWGGEVVFRKGKFQYTTFVADVSEEFKPTLNDEHTDFIWASPARLPEPTHPGVLWALKELDGKTESAAQMPLDQFIRIVTRLAADQGFDDPDKAYWQCTDFSYAVWEAAWMLGLPAELWSAEAEFQHDLNEIKKGERIAHNFLKLGDKFYDFTGRQADPHSPFPLVSRKIPYAGAARSLELENSASSSGIGESKFYLDKLWERVNAWFGKTKSVTAELEFLSAPALWNGRSEIIAGVRVGPKTYLVKNDLKDFITTYLQIADQDLKDKIDAAKSDDDIPEDFFRQNMNMIYFNDLTFRTYHPNDLLFETIMMALLARRPLPQKVRVIMYQPERDKEYLVKDLLQKGEHLLQSSAEEDEEEPDWSHLKSIRDIEPIRAELAQAAQKPYDDWAQDENGMDEELGPGGICHLIVDEMLSVLDRHGFVCTSMSLDSEVHVVTVVQVQEGIYILDIPYGIYERGGGYNWRKIPDVTFEPGDITLYRTSPDPADFKNYQEG